MSHPSGPPKISHLRLSLLTLIGVYPVITGILYAIFPLTDGWELWQRTLLLTPIMVVIMVWGLIPNIHRFFGGFLRG